MWVVYPGALSIVVFGLFQDVPLARGRLPLNVLLLTLSARPSTLQRLSAALQGRPTRLQERSPTRDRFKCVLLAVRDIETELVSTLDRTPLQVIKPALAGVLSLLPLIRRDVACVGCSFPLVGFGLTLVGGSFPVVRDLLAFVGGSLTGVKQLLPLFEASLAIVGELIDLCLPTRLFTLHVPTFRSHRLVREGRRSR